MQGCAAASGAPSTRATVPAGIHATFNVENLDPGDGGSKFARLAELIVGNLQAPDLIALEEGQGSDGPTNSAVTDPTPTLDTLVAAIEAAGEPHYQWRQIDPVDD